MPWDQEEVVEEWHYEGEHPGVIPTTRQQLQQPPPQLPHQPKDTRHVGGGSGGWWMGCVGVKWHGVPWGRTDDVTCGDELWHDLLHVDGADEMTRRTGMEWTMDLWSWVED